MPLVQMSDYCEVLDKKIKDNVWKTANYKFVKETVDNKNVYSFEYKDTEDTKEEKVNIYKSYLIKSLRIIGAAILMKYYTNSHDNFELLSYYDKIYQLTIPMIIGYTFGKSVTPISLVYIALSRCVSL